MAKNIGFFVMTEKGYQSILVLCNENLHARISFVCIGTDKGIENDFSTEIQLLCEKYAIQYCFRKDYTAYRYKADYNMAISWRWMLDLQGLIVLHDSVLPRYRGFAPLVSALINGERELGVTALFATDEYDKGAIIDQKVIQVSYPLKIAEAIRKIASLYAVIVLDIVKKILSNSDLPGIIQDESLATYSLWLDEQDYFIDWHATAQAIKRKVDACGPPYNCAKCMVESSLISLVEVEVSDDVVIENRKPGKVIFMKEGKPYIVCGSGILKITEAYYTDTGKSIFPLNKFRIQFS